MIDIETLFSDPATVEQYRSIVEAALLVGGPLTEPTRRYLEQRAIELGIHRLDAEQVLAEALTLPSIQTAIVIVKAQHEKEHQDYQALAEELRVGRLLRETLAIQVSQSQSMIEQLQQQLTTFERASRLPDGAELALIPAGGFIRGSKDYDDEQPIRRIYLDSYYIYKYPVTVKQYKQFCAATGYDMPDAPDFNANWSQEDHPIVNVSWDDAQSYCKWAGVSLPTEAQWEKAARGMDGRVYPWGHQWDNNRCQCFWADGTAPVGSFPAGASPYGVMDIAGNVWEWCLDWYDDGYYQVAPSRSPNGPESGSERVLRGGSWENSHPDNFRCALRNLNTPVIRLDNLGFRCVVRANTA